ncbi:putative phage abortive infection protein [Pseudomonas fluorescens]|uniref:putative phage abortive infection protein n=1 Tax=Pseudomonas fluorescens TaxID=294 RepID=UPI0012419A48|nr:putative phage abortive infection protein [Pseudomonas fluorescens]VVM74137.1 hypothetical protein PS676_01931 [Pseudomonas fluorescens]
MKNWKSVFAIFSVLLVVVGIYVAYYSFLYEGYFIATDDEGGLVGIRSGTFGDAFGTLNALFSGLAFSGVLITLLLQRKDLAGSQEQNARQQTESQFYSMLNLQQQVIQGFDLQPGPASMVSAIQGRDCFRSWTKKLNSANNSLRVISDIEYPLKLALEAYQKVMKDHQGDLGLYFRSLYSVFRFIDGADHTDKKHLASVVRSLLSDYELVLLFYNCLSPKGENFKRFANAYELFDNLDVDLLISKQHVLSMEKASFGKNEAALALLETHSTMAQ